jgi:hypothetical protein
MREHGHRVVAVEAFSCPVRRRRVSPNVGMPAVGPRFVCRESRRVYMSFQDAAVGTKELEAAVAPDDAELAVVVRVVMTSAEHDQIGH